MYVEKFLKFCILFESCALHNFCTYTFFTHHVTIKNAVAVLLKMIFRVFSFSCFRLGKARYRLQVSTNTGNVRTSSLLGQRQNCFGRYYINIFVDIRMVGSLTL